jgi:hypothetical protein
VKKTLAFDQLLTKLREQYDRTISFRYMDEEGDLITVRSEDDWQEALSFYMRTNLQTFKVFLDDGSSLRKSRSHGGSRLASRVSSTPSPPASRDNDNNSFNNSNPNISILSTVFSNHISPQLVPKILSPTSQQQQYSVNSPRDFNSRPGSPLISNKVVSLADLKEDGDGGIAMRWQLGEKIGSGAFGQV